MWICPSCEEEIDYLEFTASTTGIETGTVTLSENEETGGDRLKEEDWNGNSEINESNIEHYQCPECEERYYPSELIWKEEENDNNKKILEQKKEKYKNHTSCWMCLSEKRSCIHILKECLHCKYNKEPEWEEEKHNIIKPKNNIISEKDHTPKNASETSMICKNCEHVFIYEKKSSNEENEEFFECPNCATINSKADYMKKLKQ